MKKLGKRIDKMSFSAYQKSAVCGCKGTCICGCTPGMDPAATVEKGVRPSQTTFQTADFI